MKIPNLRWVIAFMLFLAAILNYIDRQTLSILAPTIQADLRLTDDDYANIASLFLGAYTVSLILSGRLVDRFGARWCMAFFVGWWSLANIMTSAAKSATSLGCFRFLLGFGEAGNWPSSTKVVSEWFSAKERGIAVGIYTMGATLGATIAPVLVTFIASNYRWQMAFVATGLLGLLWVLPWIWLYRSPREHPWITEKELAQLPDSNPGIKGEDHPAEGGGSPLKAALTNRNVWILMVGRMLTDPVWYFYQFWFAKYLYTAREVPQDKLGMTWVVFLAADIGCLAGGLLSGFFIRRGGGVVPGRLKAMLFSACLLPLSPLVATADSVILSIGVAMVIVLAHLAWLANISALLVDLIPQRQVATAFGLVAAGSGLGGIWMNEIVKRLVGEGSYTPWFVLCAFLHPVVWLVLRFGLARSGREQSV